MNSSTMKIVAGVLVLVAIVLAFVAYQSSQRFSSAPPDIVVASPNGEEVERLAAQGVVAIRPIRAYRTITAEDVAVHPFAVAPSNYFEEIDLVVGRAPITDIDVGVPLTKRYFGNASMMAQSIPPGHKAIALKVDEVIAVGSFVKPGDIVDVLLYVRGGNGGKNGSTETQARVLLDAVRVLSYEEEILLQPVEQDDEDKTSKGPRQASSRIQTVVVAVPIEDTTRVMLGASLGDLRLALHGKPGIGGPEIVDTELAVAGDGVSEKPAIAVKTALTNSIASDDEQVITAKELTALHKVKRRVSHGGGKRVRRAPSRPSGPVIVHRGAMTQKVNADGALVK